MALDSRLQVAVWRARMPHKDVIDEPETVRSQGEINTAGEAIDHSEPKQKLNRFSHLYNDSNR